ncbi:MAG: NAD(P)/FAD-dependent oxidoreductase, partial [Steroidobacteraceae bacterium]
MTDYDVAIIGAGPAGATTARLLATAGYRACLLEQSTFTEPRVGESLAPAVQGPLMQLGVWSAFLALDPLPSFGTRSVWGGDEVSEHSHLSTAYQHGWHVERRRFDHMLARCAVEAGAELRLGVRMQECAIDPEGGITLHVTDQRTESSTVKARFVVDATGRRTALARACKARHRVFDRLVGVAVEFRDPEAQRHCYTHVEATAEGWWYVAPLAADRSMAMLMCDADLVRRNHFDDVQQWFSILNRAPLTMERICTGRVQWGPRIFPAVSQRLVRTHASPVHWLAVGDAALAVDPISGSGVLRALKTAHAAASTVQRVLEGDATAIYRYEAERNAECT